MIRKMLKSDADFVYEIENQAFFEPWSKKHLIKELEDNSFLSHYVMEIEGKIVGFYIASHVLDEVEIFTIAVDKDYQKRKIASQLLTHLINSCKDLGVKKIYLEVSTKNIAAINLYTKFDFKIMGIRKNYYQKLGEDAYNMLREIND